MRNPFAHKPSISELQERDEYKSVEVSIAEKEALIRELRNRGMKPNDFSTNGKASGISWDRIKNWLNIQPGRKYDKP